MKAHKATDTQNRSKTLPSFAGIRAGILRLLQRMLPGVAIPARCQSCDTAFQLTREDLIHWGEDYWVQGIRFWRCPHCGLREEQDYHYLMYLDTH